MKPRFACAGGAAPVGPPGGPADAFGAGATAGGAVLTPCAGSTGNGPAGGGGGGAAVPAAPGPPAPGPPGPCPRRPPPPAPPPSGVDHSSTVRYLGPRIASSSLPLYVSLI